MGTKAELLPYKKIVLAVLTSIKRLFPSLTLRSKSPCRRLVSLLLYQRCAWRTWFTLQATSHSFSHQLWRMSPRMAGGRRTTTAQVKCARCSWQELFNMVSVSLMTPDHGTDEDSDAQGKENGWKTGPCWPASPKRMQTRTRKHCWRHHYSSVLSGEHQKETSSSSLEKYRFSKDVLLADGLTTSLVIAKMCWLVSRVFKGCFGWLLGGFLLGNCCCFLPWVKQVHTRSLYTTHGWGPFFKSMIFFTAPG